LSSEPELSVVLVSDTFETVRETVGYLQRQTARNCLELVIATESRAELALDERACAGFHSTQVVEVDSIALVQGPRAAAIRAARAPLVLIAETHSFPEPESLEALIERHREPWGVVGQVVLNGNPSSAMSWANALMDYGSQLEGTPGGEVGQIASHNASYKRETLLDVNDELERLLEAGNTLHEALVARGARLFLEERARTAHLNVSRPGSWIRERLAAGRAFAGNRASGWPVYRRALYVVGAPLIPVVRFTRIRRYLRRTTLPPHMAPRLYSALFAGLCVSALGELLGYAFGVGTSLRTISAMELHRRPHLR
jgi:hypothetical protein